MRKFLFPFLLLFGFVINSYAVVPFTPGNIVVVRIGDGTGTLNANGTAIFLEEYTTAGALVQSIPMPTVISGANKRFVLTGSSTSEGNITLSQDKHFLTLGGYDADVGTATVLTAAGVARVIALVSENGTINTTTAITDGYIGSNIRGVFTIDGSAFWSAGTATASTNGGTRYTTIGGTTSIQLSSTVTNTRFAYIYNGQLYVSAASGAFLGINSVGTGIPTVTGQTTVNYINTLASSSSYGFAFSPDGNTCYIADDRSIASGGGIQKWTLSGGVWTLAYTLNTGITNGCRGLTVNFSGTNPVIFATNSTANANSVVTVTDAGASSSFIAITTAATNTVYRGISFAPGIAVTPPPAPNLVSPANNSVGNLTSLNLVWNKSATAVSYRVQLATDAGFTNIIVNDSTLTDSIRTVSGLSPLTNYWWRVNAKNTGGTSSFSTAFTFKTLGVPFQITGTFVPANGSVNQPTTINFAWPKEVDQTVLNIPSAVGYWFELVTDSVTQANLVRDTTLTDTNKTVSGLSNSTNYYWRVKAKNQIGYGSFSYWQRFSTTAAIPPPPPAPGLVSPGNNSVGNLTSLNLVWNKSINAATYRVQLATDAGFSNIIVNDSTLTDSIRTVSGLSPLTNYWWRVNAKNAGGTSLFSSVFTFKTLGVPFQITSGFIPANGSTNQPIIENFRWNKPLDQTLLNPASVSNYWFELVTDSVTLANLVRDTTLTDTNKTVSGLNYSTNYYWRVKAKNQIGYGSFSYWQRFTTTPPPPAIVTLNVIPGGYYNQGTGRLNMRDTLRVYLVDSANCTRMDSNKVVVDSLTFSASLSFSNAPTGNYYLYVYQRNHLPIATRFKMGVVRGGTVSYNFTTDSAKAFGFNMIKVSNSPVRWGMIPADADRNEFIDGLDQTIWVTQNGLDGYKASDFNGDGFVDGLDQTIWIVYNGMSSFLPCQTPFVFVDREKIMREIENKLSTGKAIKNFNNK